MKDFKDMKDIIKAEDNKKKNIRIYIAALLAVQVITFSMAGCAASSTVTRASPPGPFVNTSMRGRPGSSVNESSENVPRMP
mgnify:CR=1 FL=1